MKIKTLVCTPEQSAKLIELGIKNNDCAFAWFFLPGNEMPRIGYCINGLKGGIIDASTNKIENPLQKWPAYTSQEAGVLLGLYGEKAFPKYSFIRKTFGAVVTQFTNEGKLEEQIIAHSHECTVRTAALIWLIEFGHTPADLVNWYLQNPEASPTDIESKRTQFCADWKKTNGNRLEQPKQS